jgi:TonB family protein
MTDPRFLFRFSDIRPAESTQPPAQQIGHAPGAPQQPAATISADYRGMLSVWLESHKRYPETARQRGEAGRAVLRFRVDRSGRVRDYSIVSTTGYPDLDAAVEAMMRGAILPPFPADMTAPQVEVSITVHFGLTPPPAPQMAAPTGALISESARAPSIGPGFDCAKATQPLARLICASPELSRTI